MVLLEGGAKWGVGEKLCIEGWRSRYWFGVKGRFEVVVGKPSGDFRQRVGDTSLELRSGLEK